MVLTRDARRKRGASEIQQHPQQQLEESTTTAVGNAGTVDDSDAAAASSDAVAAMPQPAGNRPAVDRTTFVVTDSDGFMALEQEMPRKKKRRTKPKPIWKQDKPPLEDLPIDVLENILTYIGDTRDLFNLVNQAKPFRKAIIPRPDIVISAAIYGGGAAATTSNNNNRKNTSTYDSKAVIESFFKQIQNKSIHIPSTLRLLRVINGVSCERGDDCLSYNLIEKTPGEALVSRRLAGKI